MVDFTVTNYKELSHTYLFFHYQPKK